MLDENLREEFADWLRPIREAAPPGLPVIRHRLRRRRARNAAAGVVTLAAAAGIALGVHVAGGPAATTVSSRPAPATATSAIPVTTARPTAIQGRYQVSASYTISAPVGTLIVSDGLGQVTVTGSQRSTVAVTERMQYSAEAPAMTRSLTGRVLTLGYTCPREQVCSASYDIQVPRGIAVRVSNGIGEIRLSSLAGPVTATSGLGDVTAVGLTSATADFTSGSGEIDAAFTAAPMNVRATTKLGGIIIRVPGTVSYHVSIQTGLGEASVTVPESSSSPHSISAAASLGGISIAPTGSNPQ
jgi:hypothetical protein